MGPTRQSNPAAGTPQVEIDPGVAGLPREADQVPVWVTGARADKEVRGHGSGANPSRTGRRDKETGMVGLVDH